MASSNALHNWKSIGPREEEVLEAQYQRNPNPPSATKMALALELHVSPQNIGRWFSARRRRDDGLARATRKDASQVIILADFFALNPFPTQQEKEELARATSLTYKQVNSWFQNQRKKNGMTNLCNLPSDRLQYWHQHVAEHIRIAEEQRAQTNFNPENSNGSPASASSTPTAQAAPAPGSASAPGPGQSHPFGSVLSKGRDQRESAGSSMDRGSSPSSARSGRQESQTSPDHTPPPLSAVSSNFPVPIPLPRPGVAPMAHPGVPASQAGSVASQRVPGQSAGGDEAPSERGPAGGGWDEQPASAGGVPGAADLVGMRKGVSVSGYAYPPPGQGQGQGQAQAEPLQRRPSASVASGETGRMGGGMEAVPRTQAEVGQQQGEPGGDWGTGRGQSPRRQLRPLEDGVPAYVQGNEYQSQTQPPQGPPRYPYAQPVSGQNQYGPPPGQLPPLDQQPPATSYPSMGMPPPPNDMAGLPPPSAPQGLPPLLQRPEFAGPGGGMYQNQQQGFRNGPPSDNNSPAVGPPRLQIAGAPPVSDPSAQYCRAPGTLAPVSTAHPVGGLVGTGAMSEVANQRPPSHIQPPGSLSLSSSHNGGAGSALPPPTSSVSSGGIYSDAARPGPRGGMDTQNNQMQAPPPDNRYRALGQSRHFRQTSSTSEVSGVSASMGRYPSGGLMGSQPVDPTRGQVSPVLPTPGQDPWWPRYPQQQQQAPPQQQQYQPPPPQQQGFPPHTGSAVAPGQLQTPAATPEDLNKPKLEPSANSSGMYAARTGRAPVHNTAGQPYSKPTGNTFGPPRPPPANSEGYPPQISPASAAPTGPNAQQPGHGGYGPGMPRPPVPMHPGMYYPYPGPEYGPPPPHGYDIYDRQMPSMAPPPMQPIPPPGAMPPPMYYGPEPVMGGFGGYPPPGYPGWTGPGGLVGMMPHGGPGAAGPW